MLEEFMNIMTDESVKGFNNEELNIEVKNLIDGLQLFSDNAKMLTDAYTDILANDNVVYLITRISQNPILSEHFPELYMNNENGESVINCQQNSPYHRYGVFRHILYTVEYVGKDNLKYSKHDLKLLKWTMFLHDIGKPFVKTTNAEGRDSFAGHDDMSVELAKQILDRLDFSEQEKKIILTLIKYHDRYLNEGELTQDNLEFLAQELENKKELFEFLIEVKTADNKAKSIDVYKKFLTVLPKYEEFATNYFKDLEPEDDELMPINFELEEPILSDDEIIGSQENIVVKKEKENVKKDKRLSDEDFNRIYDNILNDEDINYYYTPIIDVDNKNLLAYEVDIAFKLGENPEQVLQKAREDGKYDKVQQLLFVNQAGNGIDEKDETSVAILIKMDIASFDNYNNKNRIYDMMDKDNVIISFENYDEYNVIDINRLCKEITKKHGRTSLSKFNGSSFTLKELSNLEVDFVEFDVNEDKDKDKEELKALIKNCEKDTKKVIVKNIKNKKEFIDMKSKGVSFVQGKCLYASSERMEVTEENIKKKIK